MCVWAERDFAALFLLPLIGKLQHVQPTLQPVLRTGDSPSVIDRILRGQIDVALLEHPPVHKQLQIDKLLDVPYALYCSLKHPLAKQEHVSLQDLSSHRFVLTSCGDSQTSRDRYPADVPRDSIVVVEDMNMAVEACSELGTIASLPVLITRGAALHRLPLDVLPTQTLYAVYRKPIGGHPRTELLLEILQEQISEHVPER